MQDELNEALEELGKLAGDVGPALEPPGYADLLEEIAAAVRTTLDAAACSIAAMDPIEEELEFVAASGAGADRLVGTRIPAGRGIAGWVVASGQSITVSDVAQDPRFAADVAESTGYVPTSLLAIPLESEGEVLGVLSVLDAAESAGDAEVVALLTRQATLALRSSLVFRDLGSALLRAGAAKAKDTSLGEALASIAQGKLGRASELGDLAWLFYELRRQGPEEQAAAVRVLKAFLSYAAAREPLP